MVTFILMLGFPLFAYAEIDADETTEGVTAEQTMPYVETISETTDPATVNALDETSEVEALPEEETPLVNKAYERGWSVVNLFATILTIVIGIVLVVFSLLHRRSEDHAPNTFGLTVFGMVAAVISTVLFVSTEDVRLRMIAVDSFTVVHVAVLAVAILCAILTVRKDVQDPVLR
jgi:hypothetical protein